MSRNRQQETEIGQGMVFSLLRQGYWNSLSTYCQDQYKKTSDPFYMFWKAFSQHKLGNTNGAINQLLSIQQKKEISYASITALIYFQSQAKNIDREEINSLRNKQKEQRRVGSDKAFVQAILFYSYIGQFRKAADLLEQKDNGSPLYKLTKIWYRLLNIEEEDKNKLESQIDQFYQEKDKVVPKIQIFMARNNIKNTQKKFQQSLETLNQGIVYYPTFLPLMTQKYICLMSLGQWDQFHQSALEVSQRDSSNIPAAKALAFYQIARQGNADNAFMKIKQLQNLIQKKQGKNAPLLYQIAHLFLRICGRNRKIVQLLQKIIQKCRKIDPLNADFAIELGNQLLILGDVKQAYKMYQQASTLDESKLQSITGMIQCKLLQEDIDDAQNQLEFVNVMTQTVGRTPTIAYLQAMLTIRKPNQTNQSINQFYKILDGALKLQIAFSKNLTSGFSYYSKLNPNFLYSIAQLYLRPVSIKDMLEGAENSNPSGPIGKGIKLLENITKQIPGFLPAYLLLAKGKLAVGNQIDASVAISKVLQIDPRNQEGYIIEAMIKNKKKDFQAAFSSLQQAISHNFKIRENPLFMLLKGQIQYQMSDFTAAEETMQQAMSLPSVKKKLFDQGGDKKFKVISFSQKDRCSIYLLYAKCLIKNKKPKQSKSVMTQAISQFAGTNQQMHVLLTNAFIAVQSGDIKKAMSILKAVKNDSLYFVESRKMLADIHLKYLKSRKGYARCYFEIIDTNPSFENYKIYGDALIKINQPQQAAIAYQKAYEQKSDNQIIIRDLGRAYSLAHDYDRAIKFYQNNIQKLQRPDLILDLAKLCIQLKKFDRGQQLLSNQCFVAETGNYQKLKQNVQAHYQLYRLNLRRQGKFDFSPNQKARKFIKKAVSFQKLVLQKLRNQGGPVQQQRIILADLYFQVSEYTNDYEKNLETTISMLNQCIKIHPQHQKGLQLLADLLLKSGNLQKSQTTCQILLKVNPKNDQAGSILAEILLKSNQYDRAIDQFKRILQEEPDKYAVLAKLIDFFRRNNQLSQAKSYIEAAQNKASNLNDSGLCFCRGLYHKYSRNPSQALIQFNKAKKSSQYAESCLTHMIDIFLCPDQDNYFSAIQGKTKTVHAQNIRICQSLLRQMQNRASQHRFIVMESLVVMLGGKNKNVEECIQKLIQVLSRNQYPPAMLAIAIAKFITKKDVEGHNFLKLCTKIPYQPQYGQQLQKAWLLQAESLIQAKKFQNAQQVLNMLLRENKSCGKAQQLMGLIREKEQSLTQACQFYLNAYNLTQRKSASIGYRLAYNYLKTKRYVDCLEICRQVLQYNPQYLAIKVDVQEKAIQAIR